MKRFLVINRLVRQLSGGGALDNVVEVLEARAAVDGVLTALAERHAGSLAVETPAAA